MTGQRESDKHGPLHDDQLKHELDGTLRGNRSSRAEEWHDPEPPADDDPAVPPYSSDRSQENGGT